MRARNLFEENLLQRLKNASFVNLIVILSERERERESGMTLRFSMQHHVSPRIIEGL